MGAKTVAIKYTSDKFDKFTRQKALAQGVQSAEDLFNVTHQLLMTEAGKTPDLKIRLLGIRTSNWADSSQSATKSNQKSVYELMFTKKKSVKDTKKRKRNEDSTSIQREN